MECSQRPTLYHTQPVQHQRSLYNGVYWLNEMILWLVRTAISSVYMINIYVGIANASNTLITV